MSHDSDTGRSDSHRSDSRRSDTSRSDDAADERAPLEQVADRTSERVQPDDPFTEPPNSTVDDWLGQRVERDAERLDAGDRTAGEGDVSERGGGAGAGSS